ncbi:TOTE conflict system archaeo-eukaryotic primase domain-containing protein [Sphingobacterium humi]|uniref:TOTE conflict system primase domain-containing protein n=1 Tax=Sphingobacterium humi TaxID=1796905 RepID=A0A6N8KX11_9SPHI|nr:hypothetical protein [Sphingobacterium humi]MVZ60801.1 hypothetical protein [Sphingobacterium humi]
MEVELRTNDNYLLTLFEGRKDVIAIRWEKGNKSGYMPAHKLFGGNPHLMKFVTNFRVLFLNRYFVT